MSPAPASHQSGQRELRGAHIAVLGATGALGSRLVELLHTQGAAVTVVGRDEQRLRPMVRDGCVVVGDLTDDTLGDRLVAAFAPFALYGPALGVAGVAPDMKVTAPATLTAAALADVIRIAEATTVFASPAALRNVLRTAGDATTEQREALARVEVLMSAGAPVPASLLRALHDELMPRAEMHTPYGMTECLPTSDITLAEIESLAGAPDEGVCVGRPIAGVSLAVAPLPATDGEADEARGDPFGEGGGIGHRRVKSLVSVSTTSAGSMGLFRNSSAPDWVAQKRSAGSDFAVRMRTGILASMRLMARHAW